MSHSSGSPGCSPSRLRYRSASWRSALSDLAESGRRRVFRRASPFSASAASGVLSGSETAIGLGEPRGRRLRSKPASAPFAASYPSTTTWALVPDHPNPLTPALNGRSEWNGHSIGAEVTRRHSRSQSTCGVGFRKCKCLGIVRCCIESATLITLATPAAGSRWPIFVFTDPIRSGRSAGRPLPYAAAVDRNSMGSPTSVPVPCAST